MFDLEFITTISKMGDQKRVISIPRNYWEVMEKENLIGKGKTGKIRVKVKVTKI